MSRADGLSLHAFTDLDDAPEIGPYVAALEEFDRLPLLVELKHLGIQRTRTGPGARVLDVGCGFGLESLRLARAVVPGGAVTGVDASARFVAEARRRAAAEGLAVTFVEGDAVALPFPGGEFDVTRAERVLVYVPDPEAALAEMVRVTRRGGRIAVIAPDFDTNTVGVGDRATTRAILAHECDTAVVNGWLPRRLGPALAAVGAHEVEVASRMVVLTPDLAAAYFAGVASSAAAAGVVGEAVAAEWTAELTRRRADGTLFAAIGYYLFTATV
ncbi:methyltransferase domain-containing protein [Pseudonocardia sp.]|uniref:methyltransferase domain-containing protein n=1 Tax=Pseudonocardia sp. TaxID=60912 RepID=UPI003D109857